MSRTAETEELPASPRRGTPVWARLVVISCVLFLVAPTAYLAFRAEVARWYIAAGWQSALTQEWPSAQRRFTKALEWDPTNVSAGFQLVNAYLRDGDAERAMEEADRITEMARRNFDRTEAGPWRGVLSQALNSSAYCRALAKKELENALEMADESVALAGGVASRHILDTRGYLRYLTGDIEGGLEDMQAAVSSLERTYKVELHRIRQDAQLFSDKSLFRHLQQDTLVEMAVYYQHRGLLYEAEGKTTAAEDDFQRARELGYDPSQGVW